MSDSLRPHGLQHASLPCPITNSQSLLKLMPIESVMPPNHLILCRPLLLPPSIFPMIRVFSNESVLCNRWPKYCSFSISIRPSNEYSGLISRIDWFDLLAVQGLMVSRCISRCIIKNMYSDHEYNNVLNTEVLFQIRKESKGNLFKYSFQVQKLKKS